MKRKAVGFGSSHRNESWSPHVSVMWFSDVVRKLKAESVEMSTGEWAVRSSGVCLDALMGDTCSRSIEDNRRHQLASKTPDRRTSSSNLDLCTT